MANRRSHPSSRQKNLVIRYGNEYMVHDYAYMTKVAEITRAEELRGGGTGCQMEGSHKVRFNTLNGITHGNWSYVFKTTS